MSRARVYSQTQKIVVNPAQQSVAVVNAGPIGPRGQVGPTDIDMTLTADGQILTRVLGALAPISRADLAADPAFQAAFFDSAEVAAAISAAITAALASALPALIPPGSIRPTIHNVAESGWLLFNQTVTNAQTLYPALWAVVPTAWKSGTSLVLPDLANKTLLGIGVTTVGSTGGANSRTITSGNLPTHTHTIDHDHGVVTSGNASADHSHNQQGTFTSGGISANHTHGFSGTTGGQSNSHVHGRGTIYGGSSAVNFGTVIGGSSFPPSMFYTNGGTGYTADGGSTDGNNVDHSHGYSGNTGGVSSDHTHNTTISGATSGMSVTHSHTVDLPNFTGSSGNGGFANSALDTTPAHLAVAWMIKT